MRFVLLAALLTLACGGERPGGRPRPGASASPGAAAGISDDELVAFVRWQRDFIEVLGRQKAAMDATQPDPAKPLDEAMREGGERAGQVSQSFAPEIDAVYRRLPLRGQRRVRRQGHAAA